MGLPKRVIIGGLVIIAVIGGWVINNAWISDAPWWEKGKTERLRVTECKDPECINEVHGLYEVNYKGQFFTHYTQRDMESLIDTAKEGIRYVGDDYLTAWQKHLDISTKEKDKYDYIYKFTMYLDRDYSQYTDAYGYCYSKMETKECMVFSAKKAYRITPENNKSF